MSDRIKLTEEDIHVINHFGHYRVKFKSLEGNDIEWSISEAQQLKSQILYDQKKAEKFNKVFEIFTNFKENYEKITHNLETIIHNLETIIHNLETIDKNNQKIIGILEHENKQLKGIVKESIPYLDRIGGAIHLSDKFRKILGDQ